VPRHINPLLPTTFPAMAEMIREDHLIQQLLCADLEALADKLPELPPLLEIRRLCDRMERITSSHFMRAEHALRSLPPPHQPSADALETLRNMHLLDEVHAHDLIGALWQQTRQRDQSHLHVGQLAYMLRCFFDGCRRAIALKESWVATALARTPRSD